MDFSILTLNLIPLSDMVLAESTFDNRFKNDNRVVKVKGTVETFIESHKDEPIDFVYIDACHTYDAVKHDVSMVLEHIKPTVAIGGHDYSNGWPEGIKAVNEQFKNVNRFGGSWCAKF